MQIQYQWGLWQKAQHWLLLSSRWGDQYFWCLDWNNKFVARVFDPPWSCSRSGTQPQNSSRCYCMANRLRDEPPAKSFCYHIDLSYLILVPSAGTTIAIAATTIAFQSIKGFPWECDWQFDQNRFNFVTSWITKSLGMLRCWAIPLVILITILVLESNMNLNHEHLVNTAEFFF